jgi:hypothetical protein
MEIKLSALEKADKITGHKNGCLLPGTGRYAAVRRTALTGQERPFTKLSMRLDKGAEVNAVV